METLPVRKIIRIPDYDYSTPGAYFITICTQNREKLFWSGRRGELRSPAGDHRSPLPAELTHVGMIVEKEIEKLSTVYSAISVDKYCIMPDHIHMIIRIDTDKDGQTQFAPTISRVIKQFKGSITKQVGKPIWQRSFYDHGIRNQQDYDEIWQYIENNPLKYMIKRESSGRMISAPTK